MMAVFEIYGLKAASLLRDVTHGATACMMQWCRKNDLRTY